MKTEEQIKDAIAECQHMELRTMENRDVVKHKYYSIYLEALCWVLRDE